MAQCVCVNKMLKKSAVTAASLGSTGSAGMTLAAVSVSVLSPTEWDLAKFFALTYMQKVCIDLKLFIRTFFIHLYMSSV